MGRLIFLRHGETTGQSSVRYWGRTDVPLSAEGRAMARAASVALGPELITRLVTSRLSRSIECGRIAIGCRDVARTTIAEFDEIDFGDWEGLTRQEILEASPDAYECWQAAGGEFRFPGGESREEFNARVLRGCRKLESRWLDDCVLFALHRGVIRCLLEFFLDANDREGRLHVDLGALTVLTRGDDGWQIESLNRTDFL